MLEAYLDNSATTLCSPSAANAALEAMTVNYGNPSSLHKMGIKAEEYLRLARRNISSSLGVTPAEIFFTSGGTEANNIAVLGAARALKKRGRRIVTTAIEHPSVYNCAKQLENEGFEVIFLQPDEEGTVSPQAVYDAVNSDTVLVSMMYVNNETGAFLPVQDVKTAIERANSPALFHCDAVQAFGKIPIKVKKLGIDLLSASGHKIHSLKGSGFLYVRNGARVITPVYGGGQESGIRSGTQNTPGIAALSVAVNEAFDGLDRNYELVSRLNLQLKNALSAMECVKINSPENSLPFILSFSVCGVRSEILLHSLEASGVYVSSGSACSKGKKSGVLSAMGLSDERIDSAIRVSFSKYNTADDVDLLVKALNDALSHIKRKSGR